MADEDAKRFWEEEKCGNRFIQGCLFTPILTKQRSTWKGSERANSKRYFPSTVYTQMGAHLKIVHWPEGKSSFRLLSRRIWKGESKVA